MQCIGFFAFIHPRGAVGSHRTAPEDQLQLLACAMVKDTNRRNNLYVHVFDGETRAPRGNPLMHKEDVKLQTEGPGSRCESNPGGDSFNHWATVLPWDTQTLSWDPIFRNRIKNISFDNWLDCIRKNGWQRQRPLLASGSEWALIPIWCGSKYPVHKLFMMVYLYAGMPYCCPSKNSRHSTVETDSVCTFIQRRPLRP